ncbi:MAG: hypothetical protein Kow00129_09330 [Thermoleophilia bacterium]
MEFLFNSLLAHTGLGAGLSTFAGIRAFLPLAIVGLVSRLDLFEAVEVGGTGYGFLENTWVLVLFFVLSTVEIAADKVPLVDTVQDFLATPVRVVAGGILFGAMMANEETAAMVAGLIGGGILAGVTSGIKGVIRPGATVAGGGSVNPFLSFFEDVTTAFGTLLVILVPVLGLLVVAFVVFLVYRLRRRRRKKYEGLRILRE